MYGRREQIIDAVGLTLMVPLFYAVYILAWAVFGG